MTETDITRVVEILHSLSQLLTARNTNSNWGQKLKALAHKETLCVDDLKLQVKGLYGGMGSINDIVLFCSDGTVDRKGSDEFDTLRTELYDLVRSPQYSNPGG